MDFSGQIIRKHKLQEKVENLNRQIRDWIFTLLKITSMSPGIYGLTGEFDQSFTEEFISHILLKNKKKKTSQPIF